MDITREDSPKGRKSSILKAAKPRLPLQDVNMGSNYEEDTTEIRRRRVSFSSIHQVKKFNANAESLVVSDTPAYEEEFSLSTESPNIPNMLKPVSSVDNNLEVRSVAVLSSPVSGSSSDDMEIDISLDQVGNEVHGPDAKCYPVILSQLPATPGIWELNNRLSQSLEFTTPVFSSQIMESAGHRVLPPVINFQSPVTVENMSLTTAVPGIYFDTNRGVTLNSHQMEMTSVVGGDINNLTSEIVGPFSKALPPFILSNGLKDEDSGLPIAADPDKEVMELSAGKFSADVPDLSASVPFKDNFELSAVDLGKEDKRLSPVIPGNVDKPLSPSVPCNDDMELSAVVLRQDDHRLSHIVPKIHGIQTPACVLGKDDMELSAAVIAEYDNRLPPDFPGDDGIQLTAPVNYNDDMELSAAVIGKDDSQLPPVIPGNIDKPLSPSIPCNDDMELSAVVFRKDDHRLSHINPKIDGIQTPACVTGKDDMELSAAVIGSDDNQLSPVIHGKDDKPLSPSVRSNDNVELSAVVIGNDDNQLSTVIRGKDDKPFSLSVPGNDDMELSDVVLKKGEKWLSSVIPEKDNRGLAASVPGDDYTAVVLNDANRLPPVIPGTESNQLPGSVPDNEFLPAPGQNDSLLLLNCVENNSDMELSKICDISNSDTGLAVNANNIRELPIAISLSPKMMINDHSRVEDTLSPAFKKMKVSISSNVTIGMDGTSEEIEVVCREKEIRNNKSLTSGHCESSSFSSARKTRRSIGLLPDANINQHKESDRGQEIINDSQTTDIVRNFNISSVCLPAPLNLTVANVDKTEVIDHPSIVESLVATPTKSSQDHMIPNKTPDGLKISMKTCDLNITSPLPVFTEAFLNSSDNTLNKSPDREMMSSAIVSHFNQNVNSGKEDSRSSYSEPFKVISKHLKQFPHNPQTVVQVLSSDQKCKEPLPCNKSPSIVRKPATPNKGLEIPNFPFSSATMESEDCLTEHTNATAIKEVCENGVIDNETLKVLIEFRDRIRAIYPLSSSKSKVFFHSVSKSTSLTDQTVILGFDVISLFRSSFNSVPELFSKFMSMKGFEKSGEVWAKGWLKNSLTLLFKMETPSNVNVIKTESAVRRLSVIKPRLIIHPKVSDEIIRFMLEDIIKEINVDWIETNVKCFFDIMVLIESITKDIKMLELNLNSMHFIRLLDSSSSFLDGSLIFPMANIKLAVEYEVHVSLKNWRQGLQNLDIDIFKINGLSEVKVEDVRDIFQRMPNDVNKFRLFHYELFAWGLNHSVALLEYSK